MNKKRSILHPAIYIKLGYERFCDLLKVVFIEVKCIGKMQKHTGGGSNQNN